MTFDFQRSTFIIGFTAAGKTTFGKQLAEQLQVPFYDLDEEIEKKEGKTIPDIFRLKGEEVFRELEAKTLRELPLKEGVVIACGGGTPCFHNNLNYLKENGTVIYLKKTPVQILQQLSQTEIEKRPLLKNKSPEEIEQWIIETLAQREVFYLQADEIAV